LGSTRNLRAEEPDPVDPHTITNAVPIERQINVAQADQVNKADQILEAHHVGAAAQVQHADEVSIASQTGVIPIAPYRLGRRLVGRDDQIEELRSRLADKEDIALHGMPGVGKTALAVTVANDPSILGHFPEGVLWAGLGRDPDSQLLLGRWAVTLNMTPVEISRYSTAQELSDAVAERISLRRMLIVVDDAWDDRAMMFQVGGVNCAHLLTTRFPMLATRFAVEGESEVRELKEEDGLSLLRALAPEAVAAAPEKARDLVRAVGGLPLALNLVGYRLSGAHFEGQIQESLEAFRAAEERLLQEMPQRPRERSPDLPREAPISLLAVIGISDGALNPPARHALRALSVFPPKINTFSEEAALAVSTTPPASLAELAQGWLVERIRGRYALHQTIGDFARAELTEHDPFERMAEFFMEHLEAREGDYLTDRSTEWLDWLEIEYENLRAILGWAREGWPEWALRVVGALWRFWEIRGFLSEGRRQLGEALSLTGAERRTAARAKALGGAGALAYRQGDATAARPLFEERLSILQELHDEAGAADTLNDLGNTANAQGEYSDAADLYSRSLHLNEQLDNRRGAGVAMNNLGYVAYRQGDYPLALSYLDRALIIFRELGDAWDSAFPLSGKALVALWQGDPNHAAQFWNESLDVRKQIGDRRGSADSIGGLGLIAFWGENFEEAWARHQESLAIREDLSDIRGMAYSLTNLGNVASRLGDLSLAGSNFEHGLSIRRDLGDRRGIADSVCGLGRVALLANEPEVAKAKFQESLRLRSAMRDAAGMAESLEGLGQIRIKLGGEETGACLLAAAGQLRKRVGAPLWPVDRLDVQRAREAADAKLSADALAATLARGASMSSEEAVALALM
jgi:tetratricopeptide (TPR) repeat protein